MSRSGGGGGGLEGGFLRLYVDSIQGGASLHTLRPENEEQKYSK